jgi:hypothetical protein
MNKSNRCTLPSARFSNGGGERSALGFGSPSKIFRARTGAVLWRLLLALMVLPIALCGIALVGTLAGLGLTIFIGGALAGFVQTIYRWLCRIEVTPEGVKARTPFGESELRFVEVERWSVEHGDDHGKPIWKCNPVTLESNHAVHFWRRGETRITRIQDWEVANPGWAEFVETVRSNLRSKEAEP